MKKLALLLRMTVGSISTVPNIVFKTINHCCEISNQGSWNNHGLNTYKIHLQRGSKHSNVSAVNPLLHNVRIILELHGKSTDYSRIILDALAYLLSVRPIFPKSTHPKQVFSADGVPRGPVRRPSRNIFVNTSATSSKSMHAGVLKSGSASFKSERWSHTCTWGKQK